MRAIAVACTCAVVLAACASAGERGPQTSATETQAKTNAASGTSGSSGKPRRQHRHRRAGRHGRRPITRGRAGVIDHVVDGDTVVLSGGAHVRLVQIDTPEVRDAVECYGEQASATMKRWLPPGARVRIERDPALDSIDHYGRVLGYVWKGDQNLNIRLVQVGAASVWYYGGARGRYANALDHAVRAARRGRRGLWRQCLGTVLDTTSGVETGRPGLDGSRANPSHGRWGAGRIVGRSHGLPVLAPPPPDVDCGQLPGPVWAGSNDPHRLDRDGDGIGCSS